MIQGGIVGGTYGIDGGSGANPVSYYYGKDSKNASVKIIRPAGSGTSRPAEFKTTADETYNGGKNDLLTITRMAVLNLIWTPQTRPITPSSNCPQDGIISPFKDTLRDVYEQFRVELRQDSVRNRRPRCRRNTRILRGTCSRPNRISTQLARLYR